MLRLSPLKLAISKALYVPEWSVRVRRLIEQSGLNLLTDCSIPKLQHPIAQALSPCGHRPHMLCHFQENTPQCLSHSSSPFPMASARTRPCAASRPGSAAAKTEFAWCSHQAMANHDGKWARGHPAVRLRDGSRLGGA
jgi:hypothetical protein